MNDICTTSLSRDIMALPKRRNLMSDPTISLDELGRLSLFLPGVKAEGHHVTIPLTLDGLKVIRKILQERKKTPKATIGMNGSPTQEMVQAFLRDQRALQGFEKKEEVKAKVKKTIPGLDLSTLTL